MSDTDSTEPTGLDRLRRLGEKAAAPSMRHRVAELEARVADLEAEVQELRRLNRRLAELTDVISELLIPMALQDGALLTERLEAFSATL